MPRPSLPDAVPRVPGEVHRDLRATAGAQLDDALRVYGAAGEALERGDVAAAVRLLRWGRQVAPRSGALREALGVALYQSGDFDGAYRELLAYRRLTDRHDQNHLLADCARAMGRPERVEEYVRQMDAADVGDERMSEGLIVLASTRADQGDVPAGLQVIHEADLDPVEPQPHHLRLWYVAGDLYERFGRPEQARAYFERVADVDDEWLDVPDRLARLGR